MSVVCCAVIVTGLPGQESSSWLSISFHRLISSSCWARWKWLLPVGRPIMSIFSDSADYHRSYLLQTFTHELEQGVYNSPQATNLSITPKKYSRFTPYLWLILTALLIRTTLLGSNWPRTLVPPLQEDKVWSDSLHVNGILANKGNISLFTYRPSTAHSTHRVAQCIMNGLPFDIITASSQPTHF